jgi:hypothetical protein
MNCGYPRDNKLIDYACQVFKKAEKQISLIDSAQLHETRQSILPQLKKSPKGKPVIAGTRQAPVFDDLLFHVTHAARHLGMIEALRGVLFAIPGTASV